MNTLKAYEVAFNPKNNILYLGAKVKANLLNKCKSKIEIVKTFAKKTNEVFYLNLKTLYLNEYKN